MLPSPSRARLPAILFALLCMALVGSSLGAADPPTAPGSYSPATPAVSLQRLHLKYVSPLKPPVGPIHNPPEGPPGPRLEEVAVSSLKPPVGPIHNPPEGPPGPRLEEVPPKPIGPIHNPPEGPRGHRLEEEL